MAVMAALPQTPEQLLEALRLRERDLARAQAAAHLGSWRWDLASDVVTWSEELYRIFGQAPETFTPSHPAAHALVHPGDRALHTAMIERALAGGRVEPFELRLVHPSGEERVVLSTQITIERDAAGVTRSLFGAILDITEQKRAERELAAREAEARARAQELQASRRELQELAARLDSVREEEQARIARDLHDDMGQLLTGMKVNLQAIEREVDELPCAPPGLVERTVDTLALVDRAVAAVRRIASHLRPSALEWLGLDAVLRQELRSFQARTGLACAVDLAEELPPLRAEVATALYRIAQEALTNVARHARARRVEVRLRPAGGSVVLEIEDDGAGLPAGAGVAGQPETLGVLGMRERARRVGGELTLDRGGLGGARVRVTVPLPAR
ncbi:MAG: histidine kinase [Anaeromyxobacter sp.]